MAGEGDAERLVVLLEARIRDFEKNMAKASGTATKSYGQMRRDSASATRQMESDMVRSTTRLNTVLATFSTRIGSLGRVGFGELIRTSAPTIAGILGVSAALAEAKAAVEDFSRINDKSKASGLDPEFFQAIAYQAQLGGVAIDQISTALETFNRNSGLAAEGTGRMATQLKLLDPELLKSLQATSSQAERLRLVADAISKQTDASKKAAIATAAFGDAGGKLVDVLAGGSRGMDETAAAARRMGLIVSDELIGQADDIGDKFDTASRVLDLQFKEVLIQLAPVLTATVSGISSLISKVEELYNTIANAPGAGFGGNQPFSELLSPEALNQLRTDTALGMGAKGNLYSGFQFGKDGKIKLAVPNAPSSTRPGGGPDRQQQQIDAVTESLHRQLDALHQTDREQMVANELAAAHVTAASKDGQSIAALTGQLYDQRAALEANGAAGRFFAETLEGGFERLVDGSESLTDVLGDMVKALGEAVLQASLLGSGPLAGIMGTAPSQSGALGGLFGTILGGLGSAFGFADGTPNTGGRPGQPIGVVHGQEAVIPLPSGGKVPVQVIGSPPTNSNGHAVGFGGQLP